MIARPCDFLLWIVLTAATTALGQPVATDTPPAGKIAQTSIPDFSGIWAHPFLTGYEPPASGPGPVLNTSRSRNGVANFQQLVGDYTNPILQPHAAAIVKKSGEMSRAGSVYPTPSNQCWPGGVPYVFWDFLMQMFQTPDQITFVYRHGNEVRRARMNQPHPAKVTPSWYGDSVGHYEGDTLVIDTVGTKIGRYSMVDWFGTPHTPALHVVERYRLLDPEAAKEGFERDAKQHNVADGMRNANSRGKYLQLQFTVEDKSVFTTPWTATMTYGAGGDDAAADWSEYACAENIQWYPGKESDVPRAIKPDF